MGKNFANRLRQLSKKHDANKIWSLDRLFTFGQYKDCSLKDVIDIDLEYVKWAMQSNILELSKEALDYLDDYAGDMKYDTYDFMNRFDDKNNFR